MQGIKISVNYTGARGDIVLITILGYVDTTTCQEIADILKNVILEENCFIICDLRNVSYISSAGWGVFVGEIKRIRDRGGDLRIVQMSSEVFEVFEMLEFNKIIVYHDTLEEAIDEFDMIRGIDITKSGTFERKANPKTVKSLNYYENKPAKKKAGVNKKNIYQEKVSEKDLPVVEKIKRIVVQNPFWNTREISRQLRSERFGHARINYFKLKSMLKKLNLENKEKRYRYYRSR